MSTLRRAVMRSVLLAIVLLFPGLAVRAQGTGSLSGAVHDADGTALAGVALTLSSQSNIAETQSAAAPLHAVTDANGAFHFAGVTFGRYRLASDHAGDALSSQAAIDLSAAAPAQRLELTLTSASASPALQLQAAGIRGYIDPGGYSAPAGAAAAADLLHGAANLNHAEEGIGLSGSSACSLEPGLRKAAAERPGDAKASRELGRFYLAQREPEQALPLLRHAWTLDSSDPETEAALADALLLTRQFQAAHELLTSGVALPETAMKHRLLARSEEGIGAFAKAAEQYQAAASLEPSEANLYGVGYELILEGSPGPASHAFLAGAARYPDSTMLLTGAGTSAFLEGKSAEATRLFLRAIDLHPEDARPYPFLSAAFGISGIEPDAVEAHFRRWYELSPENAQAVYFYALSLVQHRPAASGTDPDQALRLFEQAVKLDPNLAAARDQLGSLFLQQGKYGQAVEQLAAAIRLQPDLWEAHYKLSSAYRHAGEPEQAERQMKLFLAHKDASTDSAHIDRFLSVFAEQETRPATESACASRP